MTSTDMHNPADEQGLGLLWGAAAIGSAIGTTEKTAWHLLENGHLPAKKVGRRWCASREALRRHFETAGDAA